MRCQRSTALAGGSSYPQITLTVNVASNAPSSVINSASVSGGGETNTSNDTVTDPTTITAATAGLSFSPGSIDFGTVTLWGGTSQYVTVTNTGATTVNFNSIFLSALQNATTQDLTYDGGCSSSLAPGNSCNAKVSLWPSKTGLVTAILNFKDNAAGSPQQVQITATVIAPKANLSSSSLDYGTHAVNSTTVKTVTLSNPGVGALTISGVTITGSNSSDFLLTGNTCGSSLAHNSSCTLSVTFKPRAMGSRSATLKITDNAQSASQTVSLEGRGN